MAELKEELLRLTAAVSKVKPELIANRLVYVQFRGALGRSLITDYRDQLRKSGFNSPGAARMVGEYGNIVKYFNVDDHDIAIKLTKTREGYFEHKECPKGVVVPEKSQSTKVLMAIELARQNHN